MHVSSSIQYVYMYYLFALNSLMLTDTRDPLETSIHYLEFEKNQQDASGRPAFVPVVQKSCGRGDFVGRWILGEQDECEHER